MLVFFLFEAIFHTGKIQEERKMKDEEKGKEKNHLLFLTVNSSYSHSSLALPLLHTAVKEFDNVWQWEKMEIVTEEDPAQTASFIAKKSPDLLCTTLYLFNHNAVMEILQRVHLLAPHIHIAAGGPEISVENASFLLKKYPFLSTVFVGEGETLLGDFLREFPVRKREKRIIPETGRGLYADWENSPYACKDPFFAFDKPFVQLETSRGCPMNCSYCTSSGIPTRYRRMEQIKEELTLLQEKGVREVRILDRTFNLPEKRGKELLELFSTFPSMRFHLEFHPQFTGKDLQETLKKMPPGLLHIEAGIQSFDEKVQNAIGRKSNSGKVKENLAFLVSLSHLFEVHTDLIAGLPEQTEESLTEDIIALMQIAPAEIQLEVLKILPGTRLEKETEKYGIIHGINPPYDVMKSASMSTESILKMRLYSRLLDLFYNHKILHEFMVQAVKSDREFLLKTANKLQKENRQINTLLDLKKRFSFLFSLLEEENNFESRFFLVCAWLDAGFPPSALSGTLLPEIVSEIPPDAMLLYGNDACREKRETKFYRIPGQKEERFYAFNRAFSMNLPSCVWKRKY